MKCEQLFRVIDSLSEEYLLFLTDICVIESPTECKQGVDRVGRYFAQKAAEQGWLVETRHQEISGDAICITMNPDAKGAPICFSGHMDTVHPIGSFGENPVQRDDENIYGPGVVDCKGGLAAAFLAMDALKRCGFADRPIKLILQSDEETGSRGSDKATVRFMGEMAKGCAAFLNVEPSRLGGHIISRKGICHFRFEITGKAAHSGTCYEGVSAIQEAARKIIQLEQYKDPDGITCNCGLISGGSAENTVPEACTFTADFRFRTREQRAKIMRIAEDVAGTAYLEGTVCRCVMTGSRDAMEKTPCNIELFEQIQGIYGENGLGEIKMIEASGGSDAADLTAMGIPCLDGFGLIGGNLHQLSEYAALDSLALAAKRLAAIAVGIS